MFVISDFGVRWCDGRAHAGRSCTCKKRASLAGTANSGLRPDGGEGVFGRAAFVGAVEDFPIAKLAASAEADAAGGDSAEGHGEHGELASGVDAGVAHGGAGEGDGFGR